MTSEKKNTFSRDTHDDRDTCSARVSYCEPGFSLQATMYLGTQYLGIHVLNTKVNSLANSLARFKCMYCGRFGKRAHFSVSPSTGGPGSATASPPPSCVGWATPCCTHQTCPTHRARNLPAAFHRWLLWRKKAAINSSNSDSMIWGWSFMSSEKNFLIRRYFKFYTVTKSNQSTKVLMPQWWNLVKTGISQPQYRMHALLQLLTCMQVVGMATVAITTVKL